MSIKPSKDPREIKIRALMAAIELYTGLVEERYLVYHKQTHRWFSPDLSLMEDRRKALEEILRDFRGSH